MADSFVKDEYFALVKSVADFDQRLLTIKGWGVTLSLAALGFAFQYRAYGFFLVAATSSVAFWIIEHTGKRHQMRHYVRMREIEVSQYIQAEPSAKPYSSPRIDWSWHSAGQSLSRGASSSAAEPVLPRDREYWYPFAGMLLHVALPHAITLAVGLYYFHQGLIGALDGFSLGAAPGK